MTSSNTDKSIVPAQLQGQSLPPDYPDLLDDLKAIVRHARIRAQRAVNTELIQMYWELGHTILERRAREGWGSKVISRLATDLRTAFPGQHGFSRSNLKYMQQMASTWPDGIGQQPVGQLPWGHIIILMSQVKNPSDLDFYATKAVHEGWSRDALSRAVAQELHLAQGAAPTNFAAALHEDAETVQDITKDPYRLDFVGLDRSHTERDIEDALVTNIVGFLTELGVGFAFVGRQYPVVIGGDEFRTDLLFYHLKLRRYVVIELKTDKPKPEHIGKLNFYTSVVNQMVRDPELDGETIGILIGKSHNSKAAVQVALDCQRHPFAVSSYEGLSPEQRAQLPTPDDFLKAVGCPLTGSQPSGWVDRVLTAGRGLLLIDGVDEVPEPERERTRRWLTDLLTAFPRNLWLLTSRPSAVREDWLGTEDFTELTLSPMRREDIAVFARRWHKAAGADPELERSLLDAVRTKPDLGRLATNPLMCGLICALHRERRGFLPRGRKALYDAALSMLLERRDRERDMHRPGDDIELDEESQVELLQKLAYWLIRNGRSEMDRTDAVDLLERMLPSMPYVADQGSAQDILKHLLVRSGLLREPTTGAIDFVHRTFQDYLGAKAAVEERDFDLLARHAHLDQWEDVVRMAVAHARPDERARLLRMLIEHGDTDTEHRTRLHLLAMACLEHATALDPAVRQEVERRAAALIPPRGLDEAKQLAEIGPVVLELLPGPEGLASEEAVAVAHTACQIGTDAALPGLVRFRDHPDVGVRNQLGGHWDRFDTDTYAREVIGHLVGDRHAFVSVRTPTELDALSTMTQHTDIWFHGDFTAQQITVALRQHPLKWLDLTDNSAIDDLEFLTSFRELREVRLQNCPEVSDLSPLGQLPLTSLVLRELPKLKKLKGLSRLTQLDMVSVNRGVEWPGLAALSRKAPLACLFPSPDARDLSAIGDFPMLRQLGLMQYLPPSPQSLRAIAGLPKLFNISLNPAELRTLAALGQQLNRLTMLYLSAGREECDLHHVVELFPSLQRFQVYEPDTLDLAPLAAHPHLKYITVYRPHRVLNAGQLPDTVELDIIPRPRESRPS